MISPTHPPQQGGPTTSTVIYQPFPVGTLPGPVGDYVLAAANAIGCDASFIALPLLASLARAIGNKRVIRLKTTWSEHSIVWAAIVGKSGTHKTPAMQAAMRFLERIQSKGIREHQGALDQHRRDMDEHFRDMAKWKKGQTTDPAPTPPAEPVCQRYITSDCTIEALAALLAVQFDGLLVTRDELAGWLNGIAEYKGGKGSDLGHWLAMWSAAPLTVDRKTGTIKMIHVPRAAVSLVGGIQPGVLQRAIGREHMQDGLCARLLLAMPEPKPVRWTDETVPTKTEQALKKVFDRLLSMEPNTNEDGEPEPMPLDLTPAAKKVWIEYFNRHRAELVDLDDDLAAAWSKLEAYAARFALIFQLCEWTGDASAGHEIDETSMTNAIELSDWFGGEAKRVYGLFDESTEDAEQREVAEWIRHRGGRTTARELRQGNRRYRNKGDAEAILCRLVEAGRGQWKVVQTATRSRRDFVLFALSTSTDSTISAASRESVDVDTVDTLQNGQPREAQP